MSNKEVGLFGSLGTVVKTGAVSITTLATGLNDGIVAGAGYTLQLKSEMAKGYMTETLGLTEDEIRGINLSEFANSMVRDSREQNLSKNYRTVAEILEAHKASK